jgi:NAD(P)-dependent dehydrogenase (short-subunit alcohol dehydrogenase family)
MFETATPGVIAVTGGGRGIGGAIVAALARRGHTVGRLTRAGSGPPVEGRVIDLKADVTDEASLGVALAALVRQAGRLTGLVNNAGIHLDMASAEMPTGELNRILQVNASAVFAGSREAYPHLKAAGGGTIVNLGSFFDRMGVKRHLAYCASKAAVGAITRCLAVEWAKDKINVVNVAPGYVATDFNAQQMAGPLGAYLARRVPTGGPGSAEEVARFIALLFDAPLPNLTGETIYMDGAQGVAH